MIQATLPRRGVQPFDLSQVDLNRMARDAIQPWADAFDSWRSGVDGMMRPFTGQQNCGCGCPTCLPDPCNCKCCVTDADLVIEGRVGERRVIPIIIENKWRRERDVELELSDFSKVADGIAIDAAIIGPKTFKLAPCGQQEVILVVNYTTAGLTPAPAPSPNTPAGTKAAAQAAAGTRDGNDTIPPGRELPDVDRCIVAYADLRVKGCDLRSIRIAVAVLHGPANPSSSTAAARAAAEMADSRDDRSLTDLGVELARRWATQRLNAVHAYGRILSDFGAGRSTTAKAAGAYAKLVVEETVRYPSDALGIATDFATALVRKAGGKVDIGGNAGHSPFQDIEISGPLGGTAAAEFLLRNPHDRACALSFVASNFAGASGETTATVAVDPAHLDLAAGDEQAVTLTATLDPKVFETGGHYTANVAITGFDDLVLRVRLTVQPA